MRNIDSAIDAMAGDTSSKMGTGGMSTKIEAARLATASGVNVVIADGRETEVITRLAQGEAIGTRFVPAASRLESRERWMLSGLSTRGRLIIDDGAVQALTQQSKSLLPAGVKAVEGEWGRGDIVDVCAGSVRIGSGIINYRFRRCYVNNGFALRRDSPQAGLRLRRRGDTPQQHGTT